MRAKIKTVSAPLVRLGDVVSMDGDGADLYVRLITGGPHSTHAAHA